MSEKEEKESTNDGKWKSIDKFHSVTMHPHQRLSDEEKEEIYSVGGGSEIESNR